jgi:heme/copper-type cytochrome/quinol oxidase subunit 2
MRIIRKISYSLAAFTLAVPVLVSAQWGGAPAETGLPGDDAAAGTSIIGIMTRIMNWLLIVVGILGVVAFIIAGILYLTSAGDDEQIGKAKKAMVYAIVGIIVALIGVIVINAVDSMLNG